MRLLELKEKEYDSLQDEVGDLRQRLKGLVGE